jgi:hypothetical protein
VPEPAASEEAVVGKERCNGVDDDADQRVDELFRDELGRYVDARHCGQCGHACDAAIANATGVHCGLVGAHPECVAEACEEGYELTPTGRCVSPAEYLCMPCAGAEDCGSLLRARCGEWAGKRHCSLDCADAGCPEGFACQAETALCLPASGDCACGGGETFELACEVEGAESARCPGRQTCQAGELSACEPDRELCDGADNDCDGRSDEDFVDERGTYARRAEHCGACGVDCGASEGSGDPPLTCGGDPFAPTCVVDCEDAGDGAQPGDRLDADRLADNGCECLVESAGDDPGLAEGQLQLDANCDGADGAVLQTYYVANDGDDSGPGSITRPLRTIGRAIELAQASLDTEQPRPNVLVASGIYVESVRLRDGVTLSGGYRRDFLARDPDGFETLLTGVDHDGADHGAALIVEPPAADARPTSIQGLSVRGFDARGDGAAAVAVYVRGAHAALTLADLRVRTGKPAAGRSGPEGAAGSPPSTAALGGEPPRAAFEDGVHTCVPGAGNRAGGGAGGRNSCGGADVSGGQGGSADCPAFGEPATPGEDGLGPVQPGRGGQGGTDVQGPIEGGSSCPDSICCGLADFTVPTLYPQAAPGAAGGGGDSGQAGAACGDALGQFVDGRWQAGQAAAGSGGAPGEGAGGGGAGGGAELRFIDGVCEFADGLGGGGGGGGAGGCGGAGGVAGGSGGPAIGLLIELDRAGALPKIVGLSIETEAGAAGGDGGAGGDGAPGGAGAIGGELAPELIATPTLAGAAPGERGGNGGPGGSGGGGGGGCGGASVGIWLSGSATTAQVQALRADNAFVLGPAGRGGRGGGGAVPAPAGAEGASIDVLVR